RRIDQRFIEYMPSNGSAWGEGLLVSEDEMMSRIDLNLQAEPVGNADRGPAVSYRLGDYPGRISFVSAVSRCFCGGCNRLRLTSRGELLGCLYLQSGANLARLLADRASTSEIAAFVRHTVESPGFRRLPRETSVAGFNPYMRKVGG
ncbi:MAG: hypothetical protein JSU65_03745, partial [Candidatus Zixiibacteriota bacterium]